MIVRHTDGHLMAFICTTLLYTDIINKSFVVAEISKFKNSSLIKRFIEISSEESRNAYSIWSTPNPLESLSLLT